MAYQLNPGTTGNMSDGGEYDNFDEVTSAQYPSAAAASAAAAALSATSAANSATAAAGSLASIGTAVTQAQNAASAASVSAANALTSANNASSSATTATNASTSATASATSATNSATSATNSASSATSSASNASTSATNAASSANAASTSATNAASSASSASTFASNSSNSAISSAGSASASASSATNSNNSAVAAATSETNAATSATNAANSSSSASTFASNASTSATNAANSASNSQTSANNSAGSATSAANSATSATASAASAAASFDSFDDRYLGAKATDPTVDNDGNALLTGAMYFNSSTNIMKVYTGSAWMNTPGIATGGTAGQVLSKVSSTNYDTTWVSLTGGLIYNGSWNASTNTPTLASGVGTQGSYYVVSVSGNTNLDGVTDWVVGDWAIYNGTTWQKIDQTNLVTSVAGRTGNVTLAYADISGLGSAATQATSSFATAAQGTNADTAYADRLKWDGGATGLVAATGRTSLGLGTAATTDSTAYATSAQGTTADTAIQTLTSVDGSVVISPTGTTRDLSVGVAGSTATLISQVRNETGATLTKGTVVYISGASGNKALVSKAIATGDATSAQTYGVVQADITNNNNGYVVIIGVVSNINTASYADGAQLYLSGTVAGALTNIKPYAPIHLVYVGIVTRSHATQGTIEVKIQNGYEMDELHNVSAQNPVNGQTLVYNQTTSLWEKANITAGTGISVTNGAGSITIAATNSGTVTSVTGSSPIASSGGATPAISLEANYGDTQNPYASKTANFVLAAPNGTAGVPTFRAVVASDIPTLNQNTTGTAANVTGTVAIANGGTGQTTANTAFNALAPSQTSNANKYLKTDGTNTSWDSVDALPSQTSQSGKYLTTNGTVASWATISLPTQTYTRTSFIATAGQTTFTVNYTSALLQVFLNGVLLDSTDYTASNGTTFVLTSAAAINDIVEAVVYNVINVGQVAANGVLGGTNGYVLTSDGTAGTWAPAPVSLPSQTGNSGKYLKTDGTTASWQTAASSGPINTNTDAITSNYDITAGFNAISVGPITQAISTILTIASGQRWQII
jgi:hypothetical protein